MAARGEALTAFLKGEEPTTKVVPELIPTEKHLREALGEVRRLSRAAERQSKGSRGRGRKMDQLVFAMGRLVAIERVMEMDPLQRAGLTPARLAVIADSIRPDDLRARLASLHGESRTVAP
ncbi:MAG TPA: hypothetical protein VGM33_03315 [Baekduia sp.]